MMSKQILSDHYDFFTSLIGQLLLSGNLIHHVGEGFDQFVVGWLLAGVSFLHGFPVSP
jgi:hypothetical protein